MKKIIRAVAIIASIAIWASCQKDSSSDVKMSIEEQISYMDTAGEEALSQIEPTDFQKLADIINDVKKISGDIQFDENSQTALTLLAVSLLKYEGTSMYLLIDCDKINGTVTIEGNKANYTTGTGKKVVFKSDNNTYSADIRITSGTKKVKLGTERITTESFDKDIDIYLLVPTAIAADIYHNSDLYMGGSLNIDASGMPADWSSLTLAAINASLDGSLFIAGKGKYRLDIKNLSLGGSIAKLDGSLYGNKGAFLAQANVSLPVSESGLSGLNFGNVEFNANLIDKIAAKSNSKGTADFYLAQSSSPHFTIDPSKETVTFSDGTQKNVEDIFNDENFPKTYSSAMIKYIQFAALFQF